MPQWSYPTPLEEPPSDTILDPRVIEINGMKFQKRSDCVYKKDYYEVVDRIARAKAMTPEEQLANPGEFEENIYRNLLQQDLWSFVYFVMKNPLANHPFIVEACKEVEDERGDSLEVWARDHLKTTIISIARQIQKVLNDPERRILYISAMRPLAVKILNLVRTLLETDFLKACFPDILWQSPEKEAPKWSEAPEGGLFLKRKGFYKEGNFAAAGLVEGMPTGDHYTDLIYDDIVTQDLLSADIMQKVKTNFDASLNIGTRDAQVTVVGTYYRHDDPLVWISERTDPVTAQPIFKIRKKPATHNGEIDGKAVFEPEAALAKKRAGDLYIFCCQKLLNPTPRGTQKLNREHLLTVSHLHVPQGLFKFMAVDGAGDAGRRVDRKADAWALGVFGIEPFRDKIGLSRVYILDLLIQEMDLVTAQNAVVDMYCRNGWILKLGVEKVGMSTTEVHIAAALRAKNKFVSVKQGNLQILKPGSRSKEYRIESALSLPLQNGKWHIVDTIAKAHSERFRQELQNFPAGKDDGLDIASYVYDMIGNYIFGEAPAEGKPESRYDAAFRRARERGSGKGWIAV